MPRRPSQRAFELPAVPRWGGRRKGAGRKPGKRPAVRHVSRPEFRRALPAHVTVRVRADVPSLRIVPIVREIERSLARGCDRAGFRLVQYSLQGNHAHLIVEADDRGALARGMTAIGSRLARAVNRVARRSGRVFADRYHVHLLTTPREVYRALRYVLLNARKHAASVSRALARPACLDPASSARWFDGWKQVSPVTERIEPAAGRMTPVARAKTWLLAVGWRRHGLLDPADVPG